ncbi:non-ribosomal peptide synthetase [Trinickia symbiotica]|uniref:Non-ribosomal peptide synthetase n=1 Tax=Trinickia symbiotica TaxID=863227 RepID=A0A2T3XWS2_9BURK|nr:non-ribosomal peptide synthetase [Trinickia symbiotica]PTB20931.1 non-ribosomal peptide synthetase [Trinickia symbiotica]
MKRFKFIAPNLAATLVIALGVARVLGSIPFAPWATEALVRFAAWFGAYGDEQVEDVYAIASLLAALILAGTLVWTTSRLLRRRRG